FLNSVHTLSWKKLFRSLPKTLQQSRTAFALFEDHQAASCFSSYDIRLLVVRGLSALGLTAPLWSNEVPASAAHGIIAAFKADYDVMSEALGRSIIRVAEFGKLFHASVMRILS
ncbi:hypothetical protein CSKR_100284, partial [Clonorchis sinensis]